MAAICLRQLSRTCDALTNNGIEATAVIVADEENIAVLNSLTKGLIATRENPGRFASVVRDNQFLSRRFNDGCQLAFDRPLPPREREPTHGEYEVTGKREYRGNAPGTTFVAKLDRNAEIRAVNRGDIILLRRIAPNLERNSYTLPLGWAANRAADFIVMCGSDDWVDHRIFLNPPPSNTALGFQRISFVREDGREMTTRHLNYPGGSGIRVYPRQVMRALNYRPADEDRKRACDTSILTNLGRTRGFTMIHRDIDPRQIVDWKTSGEQLNPYESLARHRADPATDPFEALADVFPAESLEEMAAHYGRTSPKLARTGRTPEHPRRRKAPLSLERST
jgi:hypothetical protein